MACKDKNYTRHHCREKEKHQQLPWGTVYVLLSATPCRPGNDFQSNTGYNNYGAGSKRPASNIAASSSCASGQEDESALKRMKSDECSTVTSGESASIENEVVVSDNIHKVESTRAFLMTINKDHTCELRWLEIDPCAPRSEYGPPWGNQRENVDNGSSYQHASQFSSDAYHPPPPPPGWSGFGNRNRDSEQYCTPEWNSSFRGGPPRMPLSHSDKFNCPSSQSPYDHYEQHSSHFSGMQPSMSYENNSHGESHPMYSQDKNCTRGKSNMMYLPMSKNTYQRHEHDNFNSNHQSQFGYVNPDPNIQGQYRNTEHEESRQYYSLQSKSGHCQYDSRCSPPTTTSQGHHSPSFYQGSRHNSSYNSRDEEWNSGGHPSQLRSMPTGTRPLMVFR